MYDYCIYDILDHILPYTDRPKHDTLRLEYLSACKIMDHDIKNRLHNFPVSLYEPLLKSVIYNCYLKFIHSFDISRLDYSSSIYGINIPFPDSLGILICNWPHEELVLKNQIPSLCPPVGIFPSRHKQLASQAIAEVEDMISVFNIFYNQLRTFIMQAIFNHSLPNTEGNSCNLKMLDVTGSRMVNSDILEGINNLTIDTFGHKIDIYADAGTVVIPPSTDGGFELIRNINKTNLKPYIGQSIYFKTMTVWKYSHSHYDTDSDAFLNDFYNVLALGRCEYIELKGFDIDQRSAENLCVNLPGLVGMSLKSPGSIESFSSFQNLEQLSITYYIHNGITNAICNMNKGLTYLNLSKCSLLGRELDCLAKSIHSNTLQELNISHNFMRNDSEALGLITLCQNLNNIKVLLLDYCSLNRLSLKILSKLANACIRLEFLSMTGNQFSFDKTNTIIDGLAENKSLRYVSLVLQTMHPNGRWNNDDNDENDEDVDDEDMEYQQNLCKRFHEQINKFRHIPIYISWCLPHQ